MKTIYLILILTLTFASTTAQTESLPDPEAYFSAIIVNNIDESITWYSSIMGFEVLNKVVLEERGISQANLKRGAVLLELIELKSAVNAGDVLKTYSKKTKIKGFFKFGLLVSEFDAWIDFLEKSNVVFNGSVVTDPQSGKKMVVIKDPDGNRIQLFEK